MKILLKFLIQKNKKFNEPIDHPAANDYSKNCYYITLHTYMKDCISISCYLVIPNYETIHKFEEGPWYGDLGGVYYMSSARLRSRKFLQMQKILNKYSTM